DATPTTPPTARLGPDDPRGRDGGLTRAPYARGRRPRARIEGSHGQDERSVGLPVRQQQDRQALAARPVRCPRPAVPAKAPVAAACPRWARRQGPRPEGPVVQPA